MDHKIDSKIIHGSYSTCAPHIRPGFFRYVRYDSTMKVLLIVTLIAICGGGALGSAGEGLQKSADRLLAGLGTVLEVLGALVCLLGFAIGFLLRWIWTKTAEFFENGLLTPGIVLSPLPLHVAVMAAMSQGGDEEPCWGIRRLELTSLPAHSHDAGTRIPFVSTFLAGDSVDQGRWDDFNPTPIAYGTGRRKKLEECINKLGEEAFGHLAECIRHGLVPNREGEINLVNEQFRCLETLARPRREGG